MQPTRPHAMTMQGELLARATALYRAGRLQEAERCGLAVLEREPRNVHALTLLGIIALATGRPLVAEQLFGSALTVDSRSFAAHYYGGEALRALGRHAEALRSFDAAMAIAAAVFEVHLSRALVLRELGLPIEALQGLDRALALQPANAEALNARAALLLELGHSEEAIDAADRAIAIDPGKASAHSNRAAALHRLQRHAEAVLSADHALELAPDHVFARLNRAAALRNLGRREEAVAEYDRVLARMPDSLEAHVNRAPLLQELNRPEAALESCERALRLDDSRSDVLHTRGIVLHELGRLDEALDSHQRASVLTPGPNAERDLAVAFIHLQRENLSRGWELFEHRDQPGPGAGRTAWPMPRWDGGEPLSGKTLFIYWEQGLGDTLQFCRYARLAAERGAQVSFAVQNVLRTLLETLHPNVTLLEQDRLPPGANRRCPLLSLPRAFGTTIDTIPTGVPYLSADPERVARWDEVLGRGGLRVGICWQGNPAGRVDAGRSFPVRLFEDLAKCSTVRLISLQKGPGTEQLQNLPRGMAVESLGTEFDSGSDAFLDTAAVIELLDLVITSDTAVAHLAGAMGKRTWLLLQKVPDWRWFLDRSESPWYPTMRLFRQPARGDWPAVFNAVKREVQALLETDCGRSQ